MIETDTGQAAKTKCISTFGAADRSILTVRFEMMYEPGLYAEVEKLRKAAALCVKYCKPLTVHANTKYQPSQG